MKYIDYNDNDKLFDRIKSMHTTAKGGNSCVYVVKTGRGAYAMKRFRTEDKQVMENTLNSIKLMRQVSDEHITPILATRVYLDDKYTIDTIMPLADSDVSNLIESVEGGYIEKIRLLLEMVRQIVPCMAKIHSQSLCHNDIKMRNVLSTKTPYGYRFQLSDFDTVCQVGSVPQERVCRMGTVDHWAHEIVFNPSCESYGHASDVWAFGVMILSGLSRILGANERIKSVGYLCADKYGLVLGRINNELIFSAIMDSIVSSLNELHKESLQSTTTPQEELESINRDYHFLVSLAVTCLRIDRSVRPTFEWLSNFACPLINDALY